MTADEQRHPLRNTLILIAGLLVVWQIAYWIIGDVAMRSPWQTFRYTIELAQTDLFWVHLDNTMRAFALALVIAVVVGLLIGFALGLHRLSADAMEPMLVALYSIPKVTLYPIILLAFGLGMSAKVAFGAIHGIIPVALFTMNAVRNIPLAYLRAGRAMRLTPVQTLVHVLVPASLPEIVTGFRLGFSLTLLGTLIGEMFASQRGLGHLLVRSMERNEIDIIVALAFLLTTLATAAGWLLLRLEQRLHARLPS